MTRSNHEDKRFHRQTKKGVPLTVTVHPVIKRLYQRLCRRSNFVNNGVIFSSLLLQHMLFTRRLRRCYELEGAAYLPWNNQAERRQRWSEWKASATQMTGIHPEDDSDVFDITVVDEHLLVGEPGINDESDDMVGYTIIGVTKPITVNHSRASYRSFADHTTKRFYFNLRASPRHIIEDAFKAGIAAADAVREDGEGEEWKGGAA